MPQFDFLRQFIEQTLDDVGLGGLTESEKEQYLPQLARQLQERIGIVLLPKLNNADLDRFSKLTEEGGSAGEWQAFWQSAIPNFEEEFKTVLSDFADDVRKIVQSVWALNYYYGGNRDPTR